MEGAAMSGFVFVLRVKPPKESSLIPGRAMVVIKSNVRIPDWVLNSLETIGHSPFYWWLPSKTMVIERLLSNHTIILHLEPVLWSIAGEKILEILAFAPSNSRVNFPARILHEDRFTCRVTKRVEYPIV